MPPLDSTTQEAVSAAVERLKDKPGALLPILHAIQDAVGYVPPAAVPIIADGLNLSRAEVHGVISFYHDFRYAAHGKHVLKMCRAESCQAMGCESMIRHVENRLGTKLGGTTDDQLFTLKPVYCLGNCALSPAVMLDGKLYGKVSSDVADSLIDNAQRHA